jgi:hypothetical protein
MLIALVALVGLLSVPGTMLSAACQQPAVAAMPMMGHMHHRQQPARASHDEQLCPACLAVLPSLPLAERVVLPPMVPVTGSLRSFAAFDPGLDPPPPRLA